MKKEIKSVSYQRVKQTAGFWYDWSEKISRITIEAVYEQFVKTGRLDALKLHWKEGDPHKPHIFYDSDMAKWIESASYMLFFKRDASLEQKIDQIVDLIEQGREKSGYFNSYFLQFEKDQRWQQRQSHELYCAGHLLEAALVYEEATGKKRFLELMTDYMDYIIKVFTVEKSTAFTTPGHEEIELALIKLSRRTNNTKYLDLAAHFIDNRGREEREKHTFDWYGPGYAQDQAPVSEQKEAQGHSVRFGYLYAAVADLAREREDEELYQACRRVLRDTVDKKMYVTGGVGNLSHGESFGQSYILPNREAYTETCASISLAMVYSRMLTLEPDGEYGDLLELQLYNGALSGISLSGDAFTYENPLEVFYRDTQFKEAVKAPHRPYDRQKVFSCSCCPPNISRLLGSLGGYQYSVSPHTLYAHIYSSHTASIEIAGQLITLEQKTDYPWSGEIELTLTPPEKTKFTLALRIPGWSSVHTISINREKIDPPLLKGYAHIEREWSPGDRIHLSLPMEPVELESHPLVAENAGKVALKVGPLIYCAEETDNGERLWDYIIPRSGEFKMEWKKNLLGGINQLKVKAKQRKSDFSKKGLYRPWQPEYEEKELTLIPYYAWCNREPGNMTVWLRKER
jgi:DUF1680 family protein